jgi:hypothetical protein
MSGGEGTTAEVKIVKSWGEACVRQALLAAIIFIVVVAGFVGVVVLSVSIPLTNDQRVYLWLGGFSLLLLVMIGGILAWGFLQARRRAFQLDGVFVPLGFSGKSYLWNGRQYHGIYKGRQVDIYFYRGPTLDIYLASPLNTRMGVGFKGRASKVVSNVINHPELPNTDPALQHIALHPIDENWGRSVIADPRARSAILHLLDTSSKLEFRNLLFQPEAIHLQIHHANPYVITMGTSAEWMDDLSELAGIAEALPAPQMTAAASIMEHRMRLNRGGYTLPLVGVTCGVIGFFAILTICVVFAIFNFARGGF